MNTLKRSIVLLLAGLLLAFTFSGCATLGMSGSSAKIVVMPDKTVLSPALIKKPIVITGSGWKAGEMVVVNLMPPKDVKIKGTALGEPVGIANGTADDKGNFKAKVGALAILMTFFQVGWDDNTMKPVFKEATPLPPRTYNLEAVGLDSEMKARGTLTLLPPPKKKK
jgi:hypothetical protein